MPQETFYVAQHDDTEEYVAGIDENEQPLFSDDINDAEWSSSEETVQSYINRFAIEGVKPKPKGGNHPPKPPISL